MSATVLSVGAPLLETDRPIHGIHGQRIKRGHHCIHRIAELLSRDDMRAWQVGDFCKSSRARAGLHLAIRREGEGRPMISPSTPGNCCQEPTNARRDFRCPRSKRTWARAGGGQACRTSCINARGTIPSGSRSPALLPGARPIPGCLSIRSLARKPWKEDRARYL